jgi:hypothetical protein
LLARIRRPEEPFFQSGSGRCRALINRDVVAKKKAAAAERAVSPHVRRAATTQLARHA